MAIICPLLGGGGGAQRIGLQEGTGDDQEQLARHLNKDKEQVARNLHKEQNQVARYLHTSLWYQQK